MSQRLRPTASGFTRWIDRVHHRRLLGALVLGLMVGAAEARDDAPDGAEANRALALHAPRAAAPPADAGAPERADDGPVATEPDPALATFAAPPQESTRLGANDDRDAARAEGERAGAWPTSIDPRESELLRVGGALLVVLGLALALAWFARRASLVPGAGGSSRPSGVLEVLARYPMGRGQALVVLRLVRRIVLVHHAGDRMTTVCEVGDPDEVAQVLARLEAGARKSDAARFSNILRSFEREHDAARDVSMPPRPGPDGIEIVDLTRGRGLGGRLGRRRATA